MSEADKMFEELGYDKEERCYATTGEVITYENEELSVIEFMLEAEEIKIWHITIGMGELKAINKKVEELGWN